MREMTDLSRAEKKILDLLDKRDLPPSQILDLLSGSFDENTLRLALLNLVTRQQTKWKSGRRLARRRELVHG